MCKALEDGGQRCSAHTAPHYRKALSEIVMIFPVTIEHLEKLESTAEIYASTTEGRNEVTFDMSRMEAAGRWDEAALLRAALTKGRIRSMVAKETAKVISSTIAKSAVARAKNEGIANTYLDRLSAVADTKERHTHAKSVAKLATSLAVGLGAPEGRCASCKHFLHDEMTCRGDIDSDEPCVCATSQASTPEQIMAFGLRSEARALQQELSEAEKRLAEPQIGDRYIVAKSRDEKIPVGLKGTLLCLVKKDWGMRALLETESGEVWVGMKSLERDLETVPQDSVAVPKKALATQAIHSEIQDIPEAQGDPIPVLVESLPMSRVSLALKAMRD